MPVEPVGAVLLAGVPFYLKCLVSLWKGISFGSQETSQAIAVASLQLLKWRD